jgi:hypothetical protein
LNEWKEDIAFVAFRPTPGITKSAWNSKILSRIIIKLNAGDDDDEQKKKTARAIIERLKELYNDQECGLNIQPRYSKRVNSLIWVSYDSEDFKDSPEGKARYTPKAYQSNWRARWLPWFFGPRDEEMAFEKAEQDPMLSK